MTTTMTLNEFYTLIAEGQMNEGIVAKAQELVEKHAADLEKARVKRTEKANANDAIADAVAELLKDEPMTAEDLAKAMIDAGIERVDGKQITRQYASTVMRKVIAAGKGDKCSIKVVGKKAPIVGYKRA